MRTLLQQVDFQSVLSVFTLLMAAWTRAAIAELHAEITKEQQLRCADCRKEFIARETFDQLDTRVSHVEERV